MDRTIRPSTEYFSFLIFGPLADLSADVCLAVFLSASGYFSAKAAKFSGWGLQITCDAGGTSVLRTVRLHGPLDQQNCKDR